MSKCRRQEIDNLNVFSDYRSRIKDIVKAEAFEPNTFVGENQALIDLPF